MLLGGGIHNLETSNSGIQGTVDTADNKGRRKLFVKESTYEAALADANYKPEEYEAKKQEGRDKQNLEYLKEASEYEAKELKNIFQGEMGFKNLNDLISGLASTGDFSKDEIRDYAEGAEYKGMEDFDTLYDSIAEAIDNPELYKQTSVLEKISGQIALINDEGTTSEQASKDRDKWAQEFYGKVGEAGKRIVDSEADYFARGKNADGSSNLSIEQYEATKKSLEAQQAWAEQKANEAEARAENASTAEDAEKWQEVADQWRQDAANIGTYLTMGAEAFAKAQQENQLVQDATQKAVDLQEQGASNEEIKTAMVESAQKMADAQMKPEEIAAAINQSYGTNLGKENVTVDEKTGKVDITMDESQLEGLQDQLDNLTANIKGNITEITFNGAALASGQNNPNSAFHRYGTMALGSRKGYTISGRPTLTGEEGEELVWEPKRNQAYMVGSNGPQFANISKDAVVWNAEQTKRIKKNSKVGSVGTGARGIYHLGTMANGHFGTMAGGSGMTVPGMLDINAMANIQEVTPPAEEPTIPVKADLQVEGNNTGGFIGKLFGGGKDGPSVNVAANITSFNTGDKPQSIPIIGNVTKLNTARTVDNIDATATVTRVTKSAQVAGEPVQVKATATTTKVENKQPVQKTTKSAGTQTMKVTADTSAAQAKINQLIRLFNKTYTLKYQASGPRSISVPISANFTGSWKKTVEIDKSGANGINNKGFGSLASGSRYGTIGPKNKGGLTLTGEKGFEIAWLPSENRSMILGANGPQMLNLPKDAVVFTNEQSKKILKQKAIPAGSHAADADVKYKETRYDKRRGGGGGGSPTKTKDNDKDKKKKKKKDDKDQKNNTKKAGKVIIWWENMGRKVDGVTRKIDKNQKTIESTVKRVGSTLADVQKATDQMGKNAKLNATLLKREIAQANSELKVLDKNKKASAKDRKAVKKNNYGLSTVHFSYEGTKKGKKATVKGKAKTAKYITRDKETGEYIIDQAQITKLAKKNKSKAKAVADEVGKVLDEANKRLHEAEDNLEKTYDTVISTLDTIYEQFYKIERTLSETYFLGKQIDHISKLQSLSEAAIDKEVAKLEAGVVDLSNSTDWDTSLKRMKDGINLTVGSLISLAEANGERAKASYAEYQRLWDFSTYQSNYDKFIAQQNANWKILPEAEKMKTKEYAQYRGAALAFDLMKELGYDQNNFDYTQAIAALENKNYAEDTKQAIKEAFELMDNGRNEAIENLSASAEGVTAIMNTMNEYTSFITDFEKELLSGLEEQAQEEIDELDKLNSSLTKAMKDLLDQVKKKLDERRKKEDNQQKETELSQKQQRLAMLRADTAGGHAVEIAQLEKEIADSRKDYQRSLEDQLLEKLQDQADQAEKQREKMIELSQAMKDIAEKTGTNLELVKEWVTNPKAYEEQIRKAWLANNDYENLPLQEQEKLWNEFYGKFGQYLTYRDSLPQLKAAYETNDTLKNIEKMISSYISQGASSTGRAIIDNPLYKNYKDKQNAAETQYSDWKTKNDEYTSVQSQLKSKAAELGKLQANSPKNIDEEIEALRKKLSNATIPTNTYKKGTKEYKKAQQEIDKALKEQKKLQKRYDDLVKKRDSMAKLEDEIRELENREQYLRPQVEEAKAAYDATAVQVQEAKQEYLDSIEDKDYLIPEPITNQNESTTDLYSKAAEETTDSIDVSQIVADVYKNTIQSNYNNKLKAIAKKGTLNANDFKTLVSYGKKEGKDITQVVKELLKQKGITWLEIITAMKNGKYSKYRIAKTWNSDAFKKAYDTVYGKNAYKQNSKNKKYKSYITGGLADFTGPAWLDGTSSKPELVLNAQDTKNFMALKDVLSHVMSSADNLAAASGDAIFEINVNVDHLNNDYDVDRVVERVKKKIVQDSSYRNVTQVRKFR